jgi:DNA-binding transcriptional regulator YdaS (Cro superfamily)
MESAIVRACKVLGGQKALADALQVTSQAVHLWVKKDKVPSDRVLAIEAATRGAVTRHELRPDLYPVADMVVDA